jgi:FkbM family methyltransferase
MSGWALSPEETQPRSEFDVQVDTLRRLERAGLEPRCIIDIGASNGAWSWAARSVFPLAELHLFEPLADRDRSYRSGLDRLLATPGVRAQVHPVALGESEGTKMLRMTSSPVESSLLPVALSEYFTAEAEVKVVSLDAVWAANQLPSPALLKLDTQGSELRILRGATGVLSSVQAIVVELWAWPAYGPQTPLASEVAQWLLLQGFYLTKLGPQFNDDEGHLVAFDAVFTRPPLRPSSKPL